MPAPIEVLSDLIRSRVNQVARLAGGAPIEQRDISVDCDHLIDEACRLRAAIRGGATQAQLDGIIGDVGSYLLIISAALRSTDQRRRDPAWGATMRWNGENPFRMPNAAGVIPQMTAQQAERVRMDMEAQYGQYAPVHAGPPPLEFTDDQYRQARERQMAEAYALGNLNPGTGVPTAEDPMGMRPPPTNPPPTTPPPPLEFTDDQRRQLAAQLATANLTPAPTTPHTPAPAAPVRVAPLTEPETRTWMWGRHGGSVG